MSINVGTALGYLDLDTSKFSKGFESALKDLNAFQDKTATASDKLLAVGKSMTSVGSTLTKTVTTPLLGAGTAMVMTAANFESAMTEVAAISGATGEDLEALTAKAKEMGATTKFSASESAEALKYMAMAGWDTQKMLDGLPGIMNLAAASGEDLGTVSDIVTDAMTAFGLSADQAAHFSDVLAQASNRSNTSVGLMGETFKYVAPVAGALGYNIEDMAVAIGLMANNGIKGSQAGTQLRAVLSRMAKPTDEVAGLMEELGLSLTDSEGEMLSFNEIMLKLRESFSGMTEAEKAQNAAILGGQEAMSGLLAIVNTSETDFNALTEAINNADGAAQTMSDTMQDNLYGQITILKSTIEGIAIAFGDIMLPAIKQLVQKLQEFATWINNLSEDQKELIVRVASFVAVLGPLLIILGKITTGIAGVSSAFKALTGASGILSGIKALGTAIVGLNAPVLLIIGAVAALAAAWATNFGGIRDATARIFDSVKVIVEGAVNFIRGLWDSNFLYLQDVVAVWWQNFELYWSMIFDTIAGIFEVFALAFQGDWQGVWDKIVEIFTNIWNTITQMFMNFLNFLVDTLIRIGVNLFAAAQQAFTNILTGATQIWESFKAWWAEACQDPVGTILGIGQAMFDAGANLFSMLWDGLKSIWDGITSWVSSCVDWIVSKVKFWEDESSKVSNSDNRGTGRSAGSYASGLDYVPYDNYHATLHEGEAVLTKQQNRELRNGSGGGDTYNFYSPKNIDAVTAAREFKRVKQELAEGL